MKETIIKANAFNLILNVPLFFLFICFFRCQLIIPIIFVCSVIIMSILNLFDSQGIEDQTNALSIFVASFVFFFSIIKVCTYYYEKKYKNKKSKQYIFIFYVFFLVSLLTIIFSAQAI